MIAAIAHAIEYGGDQAIAASRGEGKTTICERVLLKYVAQGRVKFPVLFSATGEAARNSLATIKQSFEQNTRLLEYYPEICAPVRALQNTPQRAKYQLLTGAEFVNGRKKFTKVEANYTWCGSEIVLPHTPGAPAGGSIIATRGLDSAVRGLKMEDRRPDVAIIDDPDTVDTSRSEDQAAKLLARIDKDIGGLGGQQRGIARVVLTTLQSRISVSYRLTDPQVSPSWKGKRFRFLMEPPANPALWEDYVALRHANFAEGDSFARGAHNFYLDHREQMDAGAKVANPNRFDATETPDGSPMEISALQRYFNEVARLGPDAVATELDNDPPEEAGLVESPITTARILRSLNGLPRGLVPSQAVLVVQGIDCGKRSLHWVVRAWTADPVGYTIAHGVQDVHGTTTGSDEGLDLAIKRAILARMDEAAEAYFLPNDELRKVDITLCDARYRPEAIYAAAAELGGKRFFPAMGFGRSQGCVRALFSQANRRVLNATTNIKPGDNWRIVRKQGIAVCEFDADVWKSWEHDRWMTDFPAPGSLSLHGEAAAERARMSDDQRHHHSYAKHIVNEKEVEEVVKGELKRYWKSYGANHWLDASAMSNVAASMGGIRLLAAKKRVTKVIDEENATEKLPTQRAAVGRRSLRDLANAK